MITPAGAPAWVKTNDHTTYGGDVNKQNYQSRGAVNPKTDVTAAQFCRMAADLADMQLVSEFATITFGCNDGPPAAPVILAYDGMISTVPTGTRNGDGSVTFSWAASYNDDYGVAGQINFAHATVSLCGVNPGMTSWTPLDLDADGRYESIRVDLYNAAGAPYASAAATLTVYTG
jgi:hypothetical protein